MKSILFAVLTVLVLSSTALAHPHVVNNPDHSQVLAGGQNHPGFVYDAETGTYNSCAGESEPADSGPAGYGLETAHHGPDAEPGKADGCFSLTTAPAETDNNPAID